MAKKLLSVIVPIFNEEENIRPLYQEVLAATEPLDIDLEIIFIDDGSTDASLDTLLQLHAGDPRVQVIQLRKNFGQSPAISAGFDRCRGDVVITMDGDLQNDPADIPRILEKLEAGNDIVNGWRKNRHDRFLTRILPSFFGNKLISFITKVKLHDYGCTLRGFRRDVVKNLILYGEMHRYIPAIASRMGVRSTEIAVNHRARKFGKSKYGLGRTFRVVLDLITIKYLLSYAHRPLQIFGGVGLLMLLSGFLSGIYLTVIKYAYRQPIAGRPLLFLTILMIFLGFQVITLGLIAEMLTKIYHEGLNKTTYSIRAINGVDHHENPHDRP